jgi:hypothetical protein
MNFHVESQTELALARKAVSLAVPIEMVRSKKTAAAAFTLACDVSSLEDKEIYLLLDIDAGYFSNIKKGKATLQADKVQSFCGIVGNTVYIEWQAFQVGCQLVRIESETERLLREAHDQIDMLRHDKRVLTEALRGVAA